MIHPVVLAEMTALALSCPPGALVEVGVYRGGSAIELMAVAREQDRALYLYDTFTGLPCYDPDMGDVMRPGDFADTSVDDVRELLPDAIIMQGLFPDTLSGDPEQVAFAHIDADQYRSIRDAIAAIWPRVVPGGMMLFDDYNCLDGATRAVHEAFGPDLPRTARGKAYAIKGRHDLAS